MTYHNCPNMEIETDEQLAIKLKCLVSEKQ